MQLVFLSMGEKMAKLHVHPNFGKTSIDIIQSYSVTPFWSCITMSTPVNPGILSNKKNGTTWFCCGNPAASTQPPPFPGTEAA